MTQSPWRWSHRLKIVGCCVCLLFLGVEPGAAEPTQFTPVDLSAEVQQSRTFENTSFEELAASSLSVIQDINFFITETESEPGLIVAQAPMLVDPRPNQQWVRYSRSSYPGPYDGTPHYTLTISFHAVGEKGANQQVRLTLDSSLKWAGSRSVAQDNPGYAAFYQDFFKHLDRTQLRARALP